MRKNQRRYDTKSEAKVQEVRNMMKAFGSTAAKCFGEQDFLDPDLVKIALSSRHERRQRLRRATDRSTGAELIPLYR
ncbi:hypothetical protein [Duganella radicis]|uniref:Uncharacterized protein n=1 Tax=Duganella radicis TaxID=551988 RepID=A0A6L6PMJ8_9BURK|nr:hypothetical protein [Duganella radicis]MTV39949.1 hypothetical protein [Duganella radicis]